MSESEFGHSPARAAGDARATVAAAWRADGPIIVSSSRAVLYAGSDEGFASAARAAAQSTRESLAAARIGR